MEFTAAAEPLAYAIRTFDSHPSTVACGKTECRQRESMKPNAIAICVLMGTALLAMASSKPTPADTGRAITFKNFPSDKQAQTSAGSIPIYKPDELEAIHMESCIKQCKLDWRFGHGWESWVSHCMRNECGVEPDPYESDAFDFYVRY